MSHAHSSGAITPILVTSFAIDIVIWSTSRKTERKETKKKDGNENLRTLTCCFPRVT